MGVIARKRGKGRVTYYVTFWKDGKRIFERAGSDKQEAVRLEARRKREVKDGTYKRPKHGGMTLAAWAEVYFAQRKTRTADEEEAAMHRYILSKPWLARMKLEDIKRHHALKAAEELAECVSETTGKLLSPKYVANIHASVGTMLERAAFEEIIPANPWKVPEDTLQRKSTVERDPYAPDEVLSLVADERLAIERRMWNALAFMTGMREGEVCGRKWRDWDRSAVPLTSLTVKTQYDGRPLKTEKRGGEQPRKVPVHPELARMLEAWWAVGFELVYARKPALDDFIVPQRDGSCHTRSSAYKAFLRDCKLVGVSAKTLHSTRHTFITFCRRGGGRKDVIERITHNAKGDIVDQYTHFDWAPLCEQVEFFWCAPGCDAACEARVLEAGNKWRRRESNPADITGTLGNGRGSAVSQASAELPQITEAIPQAAADWAAGHSLTTGDDTESDDGETPGVETRRLWLDEAVQALGLLRLGGPELAGGGRS